MLSEQMDKYVSLFPYSYFCCHLCEKGVHLVTHSLPKFAYLFFFYDFVEKKMAIYLPNLPLKFVSPLSFMLW